MLMNQCSLCKKTEKASEIAGQVNKVKADSGKPVKTYMWVYCNGNYKGAKPIVLYDWQKGRSSDFPKEFLPGYSGSFITDGYQFYHSLENPSPRLTVGGCWIHARRKFAEIIKSIAQKASQNTIAMEAYEMMTGIMAIDNQYDDLTKKEREEMRQQVLKQKVEAYFEWTKQKYTIVRHQSAIGKALFYSINQETYLKAFLMNGDIPMDNNTAERAIRPFTIGRKNWVTMDSENGAKASAIIYSIVETAKANNLRPYAYLELLLTEIPKHMYEKSLAFLEELLS